jgi:hypothetical protein
MITSMVNAEKRKEDRAVFQGRVIDISGKFITVEKTSIALPKKARALDISGANIPLETIKKGDYVIVTIEKNEATIQKTVRSPAGEKEQSIPR